MSIVRPTLISLLLFNAVTSMAGGLGLISGLVAPPIPWLAGTPFSDYVIPGIILLVGVGGSSLVASLALIKRIVHAEIVAFSAGLVMIGWIAGELMMIQVFSWLQALYFSTGFAVVILGYELEQQG